MSDLIKLLPSSVANQIAAGEVVQRPASVVKELVENAVDAGSSSVVVSISEGGREMIHIIDNGCGLSPNDALKAFERHATSKIAAATDLYNLATFGFRGEALASIASVAEVELRTKQEGDEVGTQIVINGGDVASQAVVNTPKGTQFFVKNLFYNIPARRKFLKSNSVETKHILAEFARVALCNPQIEMQLYNNDSCVYNLPSQNLRQRIVAMMGRHINSSLLDISVNTSIIKIEGFIGSPQSAKKSGTDQYLFVNNRFFKSSYFHKAIMESYNKLIPTDVQPPYFIYMTIDPSRIDVNIHPSKTEIKFEDEQAIWQILNASVRESLGKLGAVPMMDFESDRSIDIPVFDQNATFRQPANYSNGDFNPFEEKSTKPRQSFLHSPSLNSSADWEILYKDDYDSHDPSTSDGDSFRNFIADQQQEDQEFISEGFQAEEDQMVEFEEFDGRLSEISFIRLSNRYIATQVGRDIAVIDLVRAHNRVLYEQFLEKGVRGDYFVNQQELFPQSVELSPSDIALLNHAREELAQVGFDIEQQDEHSVIVKSAPADMPSLSPQQIIDSIISNLKAGNNINRTEKTARIMAETYSLSAPKMMTNSEITQLVMELLNCKEPSYTTTGKQTMTIISTDEIIKRLK